MRSVLAMDSPLMADMWWVAQSFSAACGQGFRSGYILSLKRNVYAVGVNAYFMRFRLTVCALVTRHRVLPLYHVGILHHPGHISKRQRMLKHPLTPTAACVWNLMILFTIVGFWPLEKNILKTFSISSHLSNPANRHLFIGKIPATAAMWLLHSAS